MAPLKACWGPPGGPRAPVWETLPLENHTVLYGFKTKVFLRKSESPRLTTAGSPYDLQFLISSRLWLQLIKGLTVFGPQRTGTCLWGPHTDSLTTVHLLWPSFAFSRWPLRLCKDETTVRSRFITPDLTRMTSQFNDFITVRQTDVRLIHFNSPETPLRSWPGLVRVTRVTLHAWNLTSKLQYMCVISERALLFLWPLQMNCKNAKECKL